MQQFPGLSGVLADFLVFVHLAFVVWVVLGGLLVVRRLVWAWVHLPAALWGAFVEISGSVCPLTPLENRLRAWAALQPYEGSFVEQYVVPVIYPAGLTRELQVILGLTVVVLNAAFYLKAWTRYRREQRS